MIILSSLNSSTQSDHPLTSLLYKPTSIRPLKPHLHQIHRSNQIIPIIGRIPGITRARIRIGVLLVHTSGIIQPGRITVYVAMVVSARIIHLLAVMAAGAGIGIVVDVLVIGAGGWVVSGAVCAATAGVAVCAVAGAAIITGGSGCAVATGGAVRAGAVRVGTVGVSGVTAAVGVASHFAVCLVDFDITRSSWVC